MNRYLIVSTALLVQGCSSDAGGGGAQDASSTETSTTEDSAVSQGDAPSQDGSPSPDAGGGDSSLSDGDAGPRSDGSCPASWLAAPAVDPSIAVPDGGVILHASANGTQDYTCAAASSDGGAAYAWTFVGPEAELSDCNATLIGHHLASDGGAGFPEWIETSDGTYVVGHKLAAFTPDGGAASVPWLLLQAVSHGGTGTLGNSQYIQRLDTDGGVSPAASACTQASAGTTQKVPYTADYYFFGP